MNLKLDWDTVIFESASKHFLMFQNGSSTEIVSRECFSYVVRTSSFPSLGILTMKSVVKV